MQVWRDFRFSVYPRVNSHESGPCVVLHYFEQPSRHFLLWGDNMKFFKYLAVLALAAVPLLLIEKKRRQASAPVDADDDMFERDLRVD